MRLQIIFTITLVLSCSGNSPGENLSRTGFTIPSKEIIKIYSGRKLSYHEHFVVASALKKEKRYLESVFHYLNSCYTKAPFEKNLKLFNSKILRSLETENGRTELFEDAAYEIADITYRYRRYSETVKILKQLSENKSGLHLDAVLLKAEAYKKLKMPEKGMDVLKKALTLYNDIPAVSFLRIRIASIHEKKEKWDSAFREYLKIVELDDKSWQARAASGRISSILKGKEISPGNRKELFLTAKALSINREYEKSLSLIERGGYSGKKEYLHLAVKNLCRTGKEKSLLSLLSQKREKKFILELKKTAAAEYGKMKKRKNSIALYSQIAVSGTEPYKKDALKKIARYYSLNEKSMGSMFITKFYKSYPEDPLSGKLLWLKGKSALQKEDYRKAAGFLEQSLKISPGGSYSENCRFWLYKIYSKQKKSSRATAILQDIVLKNPGSSYTMILLKRLLKGMSIHEIKKSFGKTGIGSKNDQRLFYYSLIYFKNAEISQKIKSPGFRISDKIGKYRKAYSDITGFAIKSSRRKRIEKLEHYFRIGYNRGLKREIYRLRNENIDPENLSLALSHFGLKYSNYYYLAYYSLLTLKNRKLAVDPFFMPRKFLKILYPAPYKECMRNISRKYRLEKNMLYSLIRAESFYRTSAVSRSGAVGLMQLLPSTSRDIARKLKLKNFTLMDPCTSLEIGSNYINWLKKYVGDTRTKILAAYNAGPGRVRSWKILMEQNSDPDFAIELIPYDETRSYVLRINKYIEYYRMIYDR